MPLWVRKATKIAAMARFHRHAHIETCPHLHPQSAELVWFIKVICTICFCRSSSLDILGSDYFRKNLNPLIAFDVIEHINHKFANPRLAFGFFHFTRVNLNLVHYFRTYNLLLRSLGRMGSPDLAKIVFDYMMIDGFSLDSSSLGFLVCSVASGGHFEVAKGFLVAQARLRSDEVEKISPFVCNKFLKLLVKQHRVHEAVDFFKEHILRLRILIPDTITFNTVIGGLCKIGEVEEAFDIFKTMGSFSCFPCVVTYTSIISGCSKLGKMEEASCLFDEMDANSIHPNLYTFNALIDGFGKMGDMVSAVKMYKRMSLVGYAPDVVTFTSLINGYCKIGELEQGLQLWDDMNNRGVSPNAYTFSVLINALCKKNRLNEARDFLCSLLWRSDIVPLPFMYNPVLDVFCKAGNVDDANLIATKMEEKGCKHDKMTFTILILGHCMKGRMLEAIKIFNKMLAVGCQPDSITINLLVSCLFKAGMPSEAFSIKRAALKGFDPVMSTCVRASSFQENMGISVAV